MKILFCGDIVGRAGRKAITESVPQLRQELKLDFVIANSDNSAAGFGVTKKICHQLSEAGVDAITGGDHVWDQKDTINFIGESDVLLRPHNYPQPLPGSGAKVFTDQAGRKILIIHLMGQVFIKQQLNCPFACATKILEEYQLGKNVDAIIVDFHAEATSEKNAMGNFLDGKVSFVVGTHTHIPTADERILTNGTAYLTDAGMCGDYDSIIGMEKAGPMHVFLYKTKGEAMRPAQINSELRGVYVEIDDETGLAVDIQTIKRKIKN
jgi:metallophosphoesterase (TIGR00282 family)